jgi:hypothetical protein
MRSELVFAAMTHIPNRFLLTRIAAKATRKLHRPNTRIEETVNGVLVHLKDATPIPGPQRTNNLQTLRRVEKIDSRSADQTQAVA